MINADLEARASAFTHDHKALALGRMMVGSDDMVRENTLML